MFRDKTGVNNPMYGKPKSPETLAKLSKKVYVYDSNTKELVCSYDSYKSAVKNLGVSYETIKKYLDTDKVYKNKLYYSKYL